MFLKIYTNYKPNERSLHIPSPKINFLSNLLNFWLNDPYTRQELGKDSNLGSIITLILIFQNY